MARRRRAPTPLCSLARPLSPRGPAACAAVAGLAERARSRRPRATGYAEPLPRRWQAACAERAEVDQRRRRRGSAAPQLMRRSLLFPFSLDDARVTLDNNASERSLRRVVLGRKNYLFVGNVDAGRRIAGLITRNAASTDRRQRFCISESSCFTR
jgi:hypothetical protein